MVRSLINRVPEVVAASLKGNLVEVILASGKKMNLSVTLSIFQMEQRLRSEIMRLGT
jgi:hypothetical protein